MTSVLDTILNQDYAAIERRLSAFLKNYLGTSKAGGLVVGLSGGLDSSVVATICASCLGSDKVFGLIMPTRSTPKTDQKDAEALAYSLGIKYATVQLDGLITKFADSLPRASNKKAVGNLTSRTRLSVLYYYAGIKGYLVSGTSDRSEFLIGYFTKFGDGSADIQPIISLFKSQVRALGSRVGVPQTILEKKSSPRLWPNHLAEQEIGFDYETIDSVLYLLIDRKLSQSQVAEKVGTTSRAVEKIKNMVDSSLHKRELPAAPKLIS